MDSDLLFLLGHLNSRWECNLFVWSDFRPDCRARQFLPVVGFPVHCGILSSILNCYPGDASCTSFLAMTTKKCPHMLSSVYWWSASPLAENQCQRALWLPLFLMFLVLSFLHWMQGNLRMPSVHPLHFFGVVSCLPFIQQNNMIICVFNLLF